MLTKPAHPGVNGLLAALTVEQRRPFLEAATPITVSAGKVLSDVGQPIQHVWFPTTAVVSVLSVMSNGIAVEAAVVGCEGMVPIAAFNGVDSSAEQTIAQVSGEMLRLSRQAFHACLADVPAMRTQLHRFSQTLFTFAAQSSACNRQHSVVQRCARWLLTTHDRVPDDNFYLTHLFLSHMLGVRRSSVTIAAEVLRAAGAITYTRGRVRIVDRAVLHARSCECYDTIRGTYERMLNGGFAPSALSAVAGSDTEASIARGGDPSEAAVVSPATEAVMDAQESLAEFTTRLRQAKRRSEALRDVGLSSDAMDEDDVLRLSDELSTAFEQLEVAVEEMRSQMEALEEMRFAMETQQQLWRMRFDGLPDAFIETDRDEIIVEVNRAAEELLGSPRDRLVGRPVVSLFPDTDRRGLRDVIARLKNGARSAHWSGTLIAAREGRPNVDVAVATTLTGAGSTMDRTVVDSRAPAGGYLGARWLLRAANSSISERRSMA